MNEEQKNEQTFRESYKVIASEPIARVMLEAYFKTLTALLFGVRDDRERATTRKE